MMHPLPSLLVLAIAAAPALAGSVTGTYVEKGRGTPLAGVDVAVRRAADSTFAAHAVTGADGRFRIDSLAAGRYLLRAALLGYVTDRAEIALAETAPALDLGSRALAISAIPVRGTETKTARATAIVQSDRNVYLTKDLPAAAAGTATDLLKTVPEVEVDIDDHVSLRGSSSVTIQVNGRTSPLQGEALTHWLRQTPASRIERIEVIANPSAKFDPEGGGGIVNLVTKDPVDLGWSGSVYLIAGDRTRGPNTRVAWQKGRLTLSGGTSGFWGRIGNRLDERRDILLAQPPGTWFTHSGSERRNGFGSADAAFELAATKKSTLYGSATGSLSASNYDALNTYVLTDGSAIVTSRYERAGDGTNSWHSGSATLGFQHVVEKSRNEWSAELRASDSPSSNTSDAAESWFVPDSTGLVTLLDGDDRSRDRSFQFDDTTPVGRRGKLEAGARVSARTNDGESALLALAPATLLDAGSYAYRERFVSGYVTLGSTFGKLSVQGGVRGEAASTEFESISRGATWDGDYRSVYPSANVAWDFGAGKLARFTYAKRIERPFAFYLNPDVPTLDPLNRYEGNPELAPKYTHSFGLEASWTGSRGLLRLAPFWRRTLRNWDQFRTVDSLGAAVSTWRNAAAVSFAGGTLTASLRQTKRLGGTANFSVWRETHDASNFTAVATPPATHWSMDGNATWKLTGRIDLQTWLRYIAAQTLAQGRSGAIFFSSVGTRVKLAEKASVTVYASDPFNLWKATTETRDATYAQTSVSHRTIHSWAASFSWSWGKPPQTKARPRANDEEPRPDPGDAAR